MASQLNSRKVLFCRENNNSNVDNFLTEIFIAIAISIMAIFYFMNWIVAAETIEGETIQGRKLFVETQ